MSKRDAVSHSSAEDVDSAMNFVHALDKSGELTYDVLQ